MKTKRVLRITAFICGMAAALLFCFTRYLIDNSTGFDSFLYTLGAGIEGTNYSQLVKAALPYVPVALGFAALFILTDLFCTRFLRRVEIRLYIRNSCVKLTGALTALVLAFEMVMCPLGALIYMDKMLNVRRFLSNDSTDIYERFYTKPSLVSVTAPARPKNLVMIWLESMENTYADAEHGGFQQTNLIPGLTALGDENISFSGMRAAPYAQYTFGAMFASACATPYAYSIRRNVKLNGTPARNVPFVWDVLKSSGYRTYYLCGSDSSFAGTAETLKGHGIDVIYDLTSARDEGRIPRDYYVNWGFEDSRVFEIAREQIISCAAQDGPFMYMLSTMDTHYPVGYRCEKCPRLYGDDTADIIACADRQVTEFVYWLLSQDFAQDTVIVLLGDHPRMDAHLVKGTEYSQRTLFNCFINAEASAEPARNRVCTILDMYPTLLSALGFTVEGDRIGFGTDLFSTLPTLPEQLGYGCFEKEIQKRSEYFLKYMQ